MAVPGDSRTYRRRRSPRSPLEAGAAGGHPLDNAEPFGVDAGGVRGIMIHRQPPPHPRSVDQRPVAYVRRNCLRTP